MLAWSIQITPLVGGDTSDHFVAEGDGGAMGYTWRLCRLHFAALAFNTGNLDGPQKTLSELAHRKSLHGRPSGFLPHQLG